MSQRALAKILGREHNFVARMELGDRRIDLVEFCWICEALGAQPGEVFAELLKAFGKGPGSRTKKRR